MLKFLARAAAFTALAFGVATLSTAAEPTSAPILIGHYGSLTGSEATFGQSTSRGIQLAIKEFNAAGGLKGRQVQLKEYDTAGTPMQAGTAVTRLVTEDKVCAVIGEVASSLSLAGGPVCQKHRVPMITPSSTNPRVTKVGDMIFRVCFTDDFQGFVMAKFASENLKAKKVACLFDKSQAYSSGLKDDFKKAFTAMGGEIVAEEAYSKGDPDFSAQLTKIRGLKPDAIYVPGYYTEVGNIAIQSRKLGLNIPLMGGDGWDSEELPKTAGSAIEGCYYSNHYAPDQPTAEVKEFVKKYQSEFGGSTPDGLAALGYDAAKLLFDAMGRAKSLGGEDLRQAIAESRNFKGVTGNITIDPQRNATKSAVVLVFKGGKPVYAATVDPAAGK